MKNVLRALILTCSLGAACLAYANEPRAEVLELKDGSILFLHPDGTGRMVDQHGKPIAMGDGIEMELGDGRTVVMMNKRVWMRYGPPGKGRRVLKTD